MLQAEPGHFLVMCPKDVISIRGRSAHAFTLANSGRHAQPGTR
jgi:hypothetical protein